MNTYKKVYFRINTPSYYKNKFGVGWETPEDGVKFQNHITDLFNDNGWTIKTERYNGGCNTMIKDKQELYLHPQSISGIVKENNIKAIEMLLSSSDLFKFVTTDVYEDVFDITDVEYIDMLKSKKKEIENDILKSYITKCTSLYITDAWKPLQNVLDKYKMKRLTNYDGYKTNGDSDYLYITELFEGLISNKKIITSQCQSGTGYRTVDYNDTRVIYNNQGEEQETVCNHKKLNNIMKRLSNCNWITNIRVVDNII